METNEFYIDFDYKGSTDGYKEILYNKCKDALLEKIIDNYKNTNLLKRGSIENYIKKNKKKIDSNLKAIKKNIYK